MTQTSNSLVFFGNERLSTGFTPSGAPTLQALIDAGYDIKAVVANYTKGTSRNARRLEVQDVAIAHNIPILLPRSPREIKPQLDAYGAVAGVLVAYGKIVPQAVIDIFPKGIINIHPSLLPQYRGSTPIESAVLDGASKTGVSLMQLTEEMDAGPIWAQSELTLDGSETKHDLTESLLTLGKDLLISHLPHILDGTSRPTPQDETHATYTKRITKADGELDLSKPAQQLEREIRAYAGWPKSRICLFDQDIIVTKAKVSTAKETPLTLACADNTYLEIQELIAPSGKSMSGEAFVRGYIRNN